MNSYEKLCTHYMKEILYKQTSKLEVIFALTNYSIILVMFKSNTLTEFIKQKTDGLGG